MVSARQVSMFAALLSPLKARQILTLVAMSRIQKMEGESIPTTIMLIVATILDKTS